MVDKWSKLLYGHYYSISRKIRGLWSQSEIKKFTDKTAKTLKSLFFIEFLFFFAVIILKFYRKEIYGGEKKFFVQYSTGSQVVKK